MLIVKEPNATRWDEFTNNSKLYSKAIVINFLGVTSKPIKYTCYSLYLYFYHTDSPWDLLLSLCNPQYLRGILLFSKIIFHISSRHRASQEQLSTSSIWFHPSFWWKAHKLTHQNPMTEERSPHMGKGTPMKRKRTLPNPITCVLRSMNVDTRQWYDTIWSLGHNKT